MNVASTHLRGFNGPALMASEPVGGVNPGNDFAAAMMRLSAALSASADDRERMEERAQRECASAYGGGDGPMDKPFAQVGATAIIPVSGVLLNRFTGSWGFATGYNAIRRQMNAAISDASVKNIVLDVNSPGGMAQGCMELAEDIRAAATQKPILAVVDGLACSAAYWIASAASRIAAAPSAYVGSIGVVAMHASFEKMLENEGIKVTFIKAGKHKVEGNPYEDLSEDARKQMQARVDSIYEDFLLAVAAGRKDKFSYRAARETEARVYTAADALASGMVDAVSTPSAALRAFVGGSTTSDQQEQSNTMTEKPKAETGAPDATANAEAARAEAVRAERARINGILTHAEAAGRETLAQHLATSTDLSVEAAAAILAASPKATASASKPDERDRLADAMSKTEQPGVGATDGSERKPTAAESMLAAWSAMTGRKIEDDKRPN